MYGKKKAPTQKRSCYKMTPKSPILRALVGQQHTLPPVIKEAIKAAPTKKYNTAMKKMGCAMCGYGKKKCTCGKKKY